MQTVAAVSAVSVPTVIFSHGQESGPWGTKITAMAAAVRARGWQADSVDYRGMPEPQTRIDTLIAQCADVAPPLVLVGSSMGGYVAAASAAQVEAVGLFLLAPAFFMAGLPDFEAPAVATSIVHGWHDDIVPVANSIRYAEQAAATLHVVDGDHRLTANVDEINAYLLQFIDQLSAA